MYSRMGKKIIEICLPVCNWKELEFIIRNISLSIDFILDYMDSEQLNISLQNGKIKVIDIYWNQECSLVEIIDSSIELLVKNAGLYTARKDYERASANLESAKQLAEFVKILRNVENSLITKDDKPSIIRGCWLHRLTEYEKMDLADKIDKNKFPYVSVGEDIFEISTGCDNSDIASLNIDYEKDELQEFIAIENKEFTHIVKCSDGYDFIVEIR